LLNWIISKDLLVEAILILMVWNLGLRKLKKIKLDPQVDINHPRKQ